MASTCTPSAGDERKEELPPPPPSHYEKWGNSSVDYPPSQGSLSSSLESASDASDIRWTLSSNSTTVSYTDMTPEQVERTKEFHDRNQEFLRKARSSPRHERYKSPSSVKRKSFKALPAIHDEETPESPKAQDTARQQSSEDTEKVLESKLRQMLDRHSTRPSEKQQFIKEYMLELHKERESLVAQWKSEFEQENNQRVPLETIKKNVFEPCIGMLSYAEVFISNLPLTIGAVALAWVTMGVVWFKFTEEMIDSCTPVHFNSPLCSFPEFPGCFECDTNDKSYRAALVVHNVCTVVAGVLAMTFLFKVAIAWRVVADELSNPATATPFGVICITLVCVFAGRGAAGETIVLATSFFHFCFAIWFLYMAIAKFSTLPDPSWFPSTIGISYAAIKTWLYYPVAGKILLGVCVACFLAMFFISVIRVALSKKIAAPVCWIQLSGPSITLYALTIMAQPSPQTEFLIEQDSTMNSQYNELWHRYYMPVQHFMFFLSLVGCTSAVHGLVTRWPKFREKQFSPAHVAFCFPSLSHANAIQAYRGAVNAFSTIPPGSLFKIALFSYWIMWLVGGTVLNLIFTYKFLKRLPKWTKIDTFGETEPPKPNDTIMAEMLPEAHDILDQPFVSPAVLQANEAGALIRVRRGTEDYQLRGPYRRTRQIKALGFDPTMDETELRQERAALLDWVAKNAPRTRNRTLSIPMMMKLKSKDGLDTYGSTEDTDSGRGHLRSQTLSGAPWM